MVEAVGLPDDAAEFQAEHPEIPFDYAVVVFQDTAGNPPTAATTVEYWEDLGSPEMAVFADPELGTIEHTPYTGDAVPGKCVLTPEMELLHCYTGHGNEQGIEAILEHAGSAH